VKAIEGKEIKADEFEEMDIVEEGEDKTDKMYAEFSIEAMSTVSPIMGSTNKLLVLEHMISECDCKE
jgi:hypothetical protein